MPKTLQSLALSLLGLPLMLSAQPTPAAQAGSEVLSFDQIFAENRPGSWPKQIAWHPDGDRLSYLLPDAEGTLTLWSFAAETGQPQALISAKDLPEAKLDSYQWSPKGDRLLVTSGDNYLLWDPSTRALKPLPGLGKVEQGPTFSPDGSRLAYSRDANLWVLDLASGKEKALTRDGKKDSVLNGVCDWIYWEEIWNRHPAAFWWSPDGKRLAYYRFDEAGVETYALTDYQPLYPAVRWQKYPKAGRANPKVEIRVADVASGKSVKVDTGTVPDAYLARIYWLPQGDRLAIERLNREQNHLDLLVCDTQKGRCA
ncbi:MAG TPA: DPP IV N-terminal domain-containing protein, partial [Thermoanaerobaculia bacterium]|nr:DPP IV N-terminal domain-containing protein [Thermoanaerobaculia bacterium]